MLSVFSSGSNWIGHWSLSWPFYLPLSMSVLKINFTADFSFANNRCSFDGFASESIASKEIEAKYRVLVRNPKDNFLYTMKGMEEPMALEEVNEVLEKQHRGSFVFDDFVFEVFDKNNNVIFGTKFNAREKMPDSALRADTVVYTNFTWSFDYEKDKQGLKD